jgi:thiol:disulfide interchange protein
MPMKLRLATGLWLVTMALVCGGQDAAVSGNTASPGAATVRLFDPSRDASADIANAVSDARRTGRRVLLEVGGDWCRWCHVLQQAFDRDHDLLASRERWFVFVRVNSSPENKNEKALARFGDVPAVPYFLVLDEGGKLLHGNRVAEFASKDGYSTEKLKAFLAAWSGRPAIVDATGN